MESDELLKESSPKFRWPPLTRVIAVLFLFGVVGFALWALQGGISPTRGALGVGSVAPNFTLTNAAGQQVNLADYRGKTVLLNFWATWCPPCRSEMPAIDAAAKANPNLVVLAVDLQEGPLPVQDYVQQLGLSFSPLLDTTGDVTALYHVNSLPSSFFIGPDGRIRAINVGAMDGRIIEGNLQKSS